MEHSPCEPFFKQEEQESLDQIGYQAWRPMAVSEEDHSVVKRKANWPFLYYMEEGKMYRNPIKRKRETYSELGEALW